MNQPNQALETVNGQVLAVEPARPTMIRPLATPDEALDAWQAFQALKGKLVTRDDVQHISGRDFIKKSGYLKIAAAFGVNTEIIRETKDDLTTPQGTAYFQWRITVRASAPNGRYMEAVGACASNERKFSHADADVFAQAQTRATNRAISNLIGGGEVSAEEMKAEAAPLPPICRAEAVALTQKFLEAMNQQGDFEPLPPSLELIVAACVMARGDLRRAYKILQAQVQEPAEDGLGEEAPTDD